ncbi:hypothetical protein [Nonomuraea dietziae]|uniref:hypothetical protein n=1 Tax=Nonomuraea dietziae TaxID=65515 RepID=UPI0031D2B4F2
MTTMNRHGRPRYGGLSTLGATALAAFATDASGGGAPKGAPRPRPRLSPRGR